MKGVKKFTGLKVLTFKKLILKLYFDVAKNFFLPNTL